MSFCSACWPSLIASMSLARALRVSLVFRSSRSRSICLPRSSSAGLVWGKPGAAYTSIRVARATTVTRCFTNSFSSHLLGFSEERGVALGTCHVALGPLIGRGQYSLSPLKARGLCRESPLFYASLRSDAKGGDPPIYALGCC